MAKFLLLSHGSKEEHERLSSEERAASMAYWAKLTQDLRDAGLFIAGGHADSAAMTTLRSAGDETYAVDQSVASQDEYIGGYYLLEAPHLGTVIEHISKRDDGAVHDG